MKVYAFLGLALMIASGCDVDVKDKGKLPKVNVESGRLPDVDVRGPEVKVGTQQKEITVPDIDIKTEKKTITVPDIDVKLPKENDNEVVK